MLDTFNLKDINAQYLMEPFKLLIAWSRHRSGNGINIKYCI